jgi:AraC-like DNA-binding protein
MTAFEEYPKQYLYRRIVRAKLFIDANFAGAIDLDKICDEACFSKFHFVRLFKNAYGHTPHQYLIKLRVERAMQLLGAGSPVKNACFDVGFDSVASFTGLFKRRTGMTPAAYRLERLRVGNEIASVPLKHVPNCFAENSNFR